MQRMEAGAEVPQEGQWKSEPVPISDEGVPLQVVNQAEVENAGNSDRMEGEESFEPDIVIGKRVGAKAKNYDIVAPNGDIFNLAEGSRITNVKVIAGAGRDRQIDVIESLLNKYGGDPLKWTKCKGLGHVNVNGESVLAELHWYEEPSLGRVEFKIKPQPGGDLFIYED